MGRIAAVGGLHATEDSGRDGEDIVGEAHVVRAVCDGIGRLDRLVVETAQLTNVARRQSKPAIHLLVVASVGAVLLKHEVEPVGGDAALARLGPVTAGVSLEQAKDDRVVDRLPEGSRDPVQTSTVVAASAQAAVAALGQGVARLDRAPDALLDDHPAKRLRHGSGLVTAAVGRVSVDVKRAGRAHDGVARAARADWRVAGRLARRFGGRATAERARPAVEAHDHLLGAVAGGDAPKDQRVHVVVDVADLYGRARGFSHADLKQRVATCVRRPGDAQVNGEDGDPFGNVAELAVRARLLLDEDGAAGGRDGACLAQMGRIAAVERVHATKEPWRRAELAGPADVVVVVSHFVWRHNRFVRESAEIA